MSRFIDDYLKIRAADNERWKDRALKAEKQLETVQHKVDAYDAMCDVGLIQFDPSIPNHVYSVWGFTCWHHDEDILKAIAAANEPVKTKAAIGEEETPIRDLEEVFND